MQHPKAASIELERLNPFVGAWDTAGEMHAGPAKQPVKFKARDTYEWMSGGHFLLHRFDADMPDGKVQGIEVIGYSRESGSYPMHSFDSQGQANLMQARVEKDRWTYLGEGVRFTGGFREEGKVFAGLWELRPEDGSEWQAWMHITLTKVG